MGVEELAEVLLLEPPLPDVAPLFCQELWADPGALIGGDAITLPRLARAPRLIPPTPRAKGGREGYEPTPLTASIGLTLA